MSLQLKGIFIAMFACIYVPNFPVEAIMRTDPWLRERPVAVLEGKPPLIHVIALNEKARLLGMEVGMTKIQAAIFAERATGEFAQANGSYSRPTNPGESGVAVLRQRSLEQESSAHAALLDVAHAFTPRVEDTASDTLALDLFGLERLYGAPARMANTLAASMMEIGIDTNIAIAANPDAAMHAARGFNGITVIPAGEEAQRLGVLPLPILLDTLEISSGKKDSQTPECEKLHAQILDTLERWGVRDFRTLALLPEHALASRLGETGVQLRRLACGRAMRTLVLCEPPSQFEEALELESPVETIESLSFVLNRLLQQLCARLETRALAAQQLRLRLQLERRVADEEITTIEELNPSAESHNVVLERILRLPVAMRDAKVFLKLLQLDLAAHPPGAPVLKIWIDAQPAPPRVAQRGLFLPAAPEPEKLEITLTRITALVGERRAGIARLLDSKRCDSFRMDRFQVAANDATLSLAHTLSDTKGERPLAMRMFRPARRIQVLTSQERPVSLIHERLQGKIVWSAGPWGSSGDWWETHAKGKNPSTSQSSWDREEWDVAVTNKNSSDAENDHPGNITLYRIYRDIAAGCWYADACYD